MFNAHDHAWLGFIRAATRDTVVATKLKETKSIP